MSHASRRITRQVSRPTHTRAPCTVFRVRDPCNVLILMHGRIQTGGLVERFADHRIGSDKKITELNFLIDGNGVNPKPCGIVRLAELKAVFVMDGIPVFLFQKTAADQFIQADRKPLFAGMTSWK